MTISIEKYVCNLISGREAITNLYYNTDVALQQRNNGLQFCYKVTLRKVGCKTYNGYQLVQLNNRALCMSTSSVLEELEHASTPSEIMDSYVLMLLNIRIPLMQLYQSRYRAMYMRSACKLFSYTFVNPLGTPAGTSKNKLSFCNASRFLSFFENCLCHKFNAKLIVGDISAI